MQDTGNEEFLRCLLMYGIMIGSIIFSSVALVLSPMLSKTRKGFGKGTDIMLLNFLPAYISCIGKNVPFRVTLNVVMMVLLSFHPATEVILLRFGARVLLQPRKTLVVFAIDLSPLMRGFGFVRFLKRLNKNNQFQLFCVLLAKGRPSLL